jgi:PAS domain S-box-containing protein
VDETSSGRGPVITERHLTQEPLAASESRLRAVIDASPVPIALNDEHGTITYVTPSFTRAFGYDLHDIPTLLDWWPKAYPDAAYRDWIAAEWQRRLDRARREGVPFDPVEVTIRCKDGFRRTVIAGAAPLVGAFEGTHLVTLYDITERKLAEAALMESELRLRTALKIGAMGYLDWDLRTNQISWSPETYRMFGYEPDGAFSPTPESTVGMVAPEDRALVEQQRDAAIQGTAEYDLDHRMVRADGRVIHVHAQSEVMRDAQAMPLRMFGTVVDITDRKATEAALRAANLQLAEADRRKDEFLAVLSHELRNPLTPIRNSLFVLEQPESDPEQNGRALAIIARQVSHLAHLVDDLLDVTRITQGKIRLQRKRLDLVDVVCRTVEDHRSLLEEREVIVEMPKRAVWIDGDPTRLAQIVGNLLHNAAKFTPARGRVAVSLTEDEGDAVLEVADTGVGVDSDTLARMFEPFAQADRSLDRSRGGLGLGLALVKGIVGLHGGRAVAHSDGPGRGARFVIRLPLDDRNAPAPRSLASDEARKIARRVLIIEDNVDAADSLADTLVLSGHVVAVAYDGATGLDKARELKPQVILCDIGLPGGIDGYDVARTLRLDPSMASVFLVALTGYVRPEDQQRAREAGFDAHVAKPPDLDSLRRLVAEGSVTLAR